MYEICHSILRSDNEVERRWSIAKSVRSSSRICLTLLMLDSIIFLKVNKKYFGLHAVIQAINTERRA